MNALVPVINQQIAAETQAAVAQIAAGGEVIVRGITIRHLPSPTPRTSDSWFVEIPLPRTGKHETVDRRQHNTAERAAESAATAIFARVRAEHKTPEAVHAALRAFVPLVRVYRGQGVRITVYADATPGILVYEVVGSGIPTDANFWRGSEADLLLTILDPMGYIVSAGQIVIDPALQIGAAS